MADPSQNEPARDRWHLPAAPAPVPRTPPWLDACREALRATDALPLAQAATVSPGGLPEVRSVVLRGLTRDGAGVVTTDLRSAKADAIRAGSHVELCLWLAEHGLQIRLRGPAALVDAADEPWSEVRSGLWREQRDAERRGVAGPPPGTPLPSSPEHAEDRREERAVEHPPAPKHPHANFGLIVVSARRCEFLRLGDPHQREVYRWSAAGGWSGGRVTP